jgi:hypothetical protein
MAAERNGGQVHLEEEVEAKLRAQLREDGLCQAHLPSSPVDGGLAIATPTGPLTRPWQPSLIRVSDIIKRRDLHPSAC